MKSRILFVSLFAIASHAADAQQINPVPKSSDIQVIVVTTPAATGDTINLLLSAKSGDCSTKGKSVALQAGSPNVVRATADTTVTVNPGSLNPGAYLCAVMKDGKGKVTATTPEVQVGAPDPSVISPFEDKTFYFTFLGGIEQSDLSAQSSVTEGFYDLTMHAMLQKNRGGIWFRSRYLGTPSSSSKQNIVSAATNPTGTLTTSNLPQSVTAVDYALGYQFGDYNLGKQDKELTWSPIVGFGATTPLSATTIVDGFTVPAYGTNECTQLGMRFTNAKGYSPALPGPGYYTGTNGTVQMGCVVQPGVSGTTSSTQPGTQITTIGFSNEDRSSFLIKWGAGVRITDRWFVKPADETTWCSKSDCSRLTADFSIGQDEAITGGHLRHWVLKADATVPIEDSGFYFFGASANRLERNTTLSPLILTPVTLAPTTTVTSTCTASATTVCYPSPSVFILPYKQQDRDYYRIGIGVNVMKLLTKLFPAVAKTSDTTGGGF